MNKLDKFRLSLYIKLHNYLYQKISKLAIILNDDIHPKHRIMKYHQYFLDKIEKNSNILDIGCSIGLISYKIAEKANKVVAIDIDKNAIEIAKKRYNRNNIIYINYDATRHNFENVFDYLILSNVLEHIKNRNRFLKKNKKLSKYLLIRVPMINRGWLPLFKKELGFEYRLDQTHYIEYTLDTFKKEMKDARKNYFL
ncbi:unnamed protein product [marine sediment metagenome]|uniref:Methyltransferase type 11 domain-containing protein n=1 Tax=marine sediment metagenome TaxID=412755 RepID=X1AM60_9ZZZZ